MAESKEGLRDAARDLNSGAVHLLRGLRAVDRRAGLTPARLSALSVLVFGGPRSLGRLARDEDVAGPTMTRIVDGLVALGLAVREPHPDSARSVRIRATDDGERLMRCAAEARFDVILDALEALTAADRTALVRAVPALTRLAGQVSGERTSPSWLGGRAPPRR
ncbi:MAG TPA: MarR family winged helix-turn-helix transcriptional regulator [Jatrophihabitantaceae bacterium]|jgi:DNA-binding MarR family transcriptional regulator|nr:MarR family winged helix-turn-helix transcriptional regulator [Jatrophihabitantaceae bacterium]